MTMHKVKIVALAFALCWLLLGCEESVSDWPAREARIVDAATGKPLADVIVVALWKGTASYSNSVCFHVETVTTGKDGRFRVPAWTNTTEWRFTQSQWVDLVFYKAGYEESKESRRIHKLDQKEFSMSTFSGSVSERLEYLLTMSVSCSPDEDKKLVSLYKGLHAEASNIAMTTEDKLKALTLLVEVEKQEVGSTEAWRRFEQRKIELR